jgi:hypothetical protein
LVLAFGGRKIFLMGGGNTWPAAMKNCYCLSIEELKKTKLPCVVV